MKLVLNKHQQELAEKNHNLIYWFIKKNKLDLEEYYGELAIELCKAAYHYDETFGCSFTTYASKCMNNRVKQLFQKKKHTIEGTENCLSLDYFYSTEGSDSYTLADLIVDEKKNIERETEIKAEEEDFSSILNKRDQYIFRSLLSGKKQGDLARELKVSPQHINAIVKSIRKKYCARKAEEDKN